MLHFSYTQLYFLNKLQRFSALFGAILTDPPKRLVVLIKESNQM